MVRDIIIQLLCPPLNYEGNLGTLRSTPNNVKCEVIHAGLTRNLLVNSLLIKFDVICVHS